MERVIDVKAAFSGAGEGRRRCCYGFSAQERGVAVGLQPRGVACRPEEASILTTHQPTIRLTGGIISCLQAAQEVRAEAKRSS